MRVCADASESSRWWWRYCIWIRGEQQLPFMHVLCDWTSESVGDLQKGQSKTKPFFDRPDWVWIRYVQNKDRNKPARTCDDIMISCWNRAAYNSCSAVWLAGMSLSCLSGWWMQQRQQPVRWAEWFEWFEWFEWSDFTNFNRLQSFENHQSMAAWQHGSMAAWHRRPLWGAAGLEQHRFQVAQLPLNIFENGAVLGRGPGLRKEVEVRRNKQILNNKSIGIRWTTVIVESIGTNQKANREIIWKLFSNLLWGP